MRKSEREIEKSEKAVTGRRETVRKCKRREGKARKRVRGMKKCMIKEEKTKVKT